MTKITVDKDLIEQAIAALFDRIGVSHFTLRQRLRAALAEPVVEPTYTSTQATTCASCGEHKHTPLRIDQMGGYVCLTCIDQRLGSLLGEFGYPEETSAVEPVAWRAKDANGRWMYGNLPAPELPADAPQLLFASPPPPAEPAVEPDRYAWYQYMDHGNGMGWIEHMAAYDPRMPEYAEMYHRVDWVDTKQVRNFRALYASPPPPAEPAVEPVYQLQLANGDWRAITKSSYDYNLKYGWTVRVLPPTVVDKAKPAPVPQLTPSEVAQMWVAESFDTMSHESCYIRGVKRGEQAVRRAFGAHE